MALSLAHVLEFPGKRRLGRDTYFEVQTIYYPGFTIGGAFGEFGAIIATLGLLAATPFGTRAFWSTLVAAVSLLTMHATYWVWTHPVNKIWMRDREVEGVGAFLRGGMGRSRRPRLDPSPRPLGVFARRTRRFCDGGFDRAAGRRPRAVIRD